MRPLSNLQPPQKMPPSTGTTTTKPRKTTTTTTVNHHHHTSSSALFCRQHHPSATATLDLLILIIVLISGTFLITSYFSYLLHSLSLLLPLTLPLPLPLPAVVAASTLSFLVVSFFILLRPRGRRCGNPLCKGMKKALEFDLQLQSEDTLRKRCGLGVSNNNSDLVDKLPWKGGSESNPDYECLRAELRKMAPPNGRAVLLFRAKCGCPVAKLVGWGPKKGRKHKKVLASTANSGDHR